MGAAVIYQQVLQALRPMYVFLCPEHKEQPSGNGQFTRLQDYIHHANLCDFMTRVTAVMAGVE
jgi:hypothetical protein